jgi:hypothetical protein
MLFKFKKMSDNEFDTVEVDEPETISLLPNPREILTNYLNDWYHTTHHQAHYKSKQVNIDLVIKNINELIKFLGNSDLKIYHDFAYKILVLNLSEKFENISEYEIKNNELEKKIFKDLDDMTNHIESICSEKYRSDIRLFMCGFDTDPNFTIPNTCDDQNDVIHEDFIILLNYLKNKKIYQFEKKLNSIQNKAKVKLQKYYSLMLNDFIIFLYQIAEKYKHHNFRNLLSKMYPSIDQNSTIFSNIIRSHQNFKIFDDKNERNQNEVFKKITMIFNTLSSPFKDDERLILLL